MQNDKIEFLDALPQDLEEKMNKDLIAYETAHGIDVNYKKFSLVIKNNEEVVVGVLNGYTAFSEIYVDDIWVDSPFRKKGYGRKLLVELEKRYSGKGFNNINLVTNAFQAPEFYKKCGFTVEFVRRNTKNPQLDKTFFVKFFQEEIQHQGLLIE